MRTPLAFASSLVFLCGALAGASATAANLGAVYDMARGADAQFAAQVAAAAAGREKKAQGRALLLPQVGISGNSGRNRSYSTTYPGVAEYPASAWKLSLTQPLFRLDSLKSYEQGELQAMLADQQLRLAEQDLLLRIAKGYFDVLLAQDVLASVGAQKEAFAQQLAQSRRGYEVGIAPVTDVNEAQSRYDLTLAQEIASRNDLEVKRRVLEKSIARDLPPLARLDAEASIDILSPDQQDLLATRATDDALPVIIGLTAEEVAQREVERQKAGHYPTLDLVASTGENRNVNYSGLGGGLGVNSRETIVGLTLAIPIFQGGAVESRVREASANLDRSRQELLNARRQARLDSREALLGVQSGTALYQALRKAQSSNETQVRSTRRGLEVGVRTRVDVLNAEQQLFATLKDLAASRYETLMSGLRLKAAAGALTEQELRALDRLLLE
jgi:outer membrane protein